MIPMVHKFFKYVTIILAAALVMLVVYCGFWSILAFMESSTEKVQHGDPVFPNNWKSYIWNDGLAESRYDASYDSCAVNLDNRGNGTILMHLDCAAEHYGVTHSSRSGEKHTFVTEPGAFDLALGDFDECFMKAAHLDANPAREGDRTVSIIVDCDPKY